jgi:aryl-alcohol dehydrogenase-like predicted oxidoreductase
MTKTIDLGGVFTPAGTGITVNRMGYGAMQLAGPRVFGPPKDWAEAIAVVREAVESGVDHIDTADFYGPHVVNEILREALHPYPAGLTLVTKVGAKRGRMPSGFRTDRARRWFPRWRTTCGTLAWMRWTW